MYVTKEKRKPDKVLRRKSVVKTKQDASSSRRVEYVAGSVLAVRNQNARKRNAEMRSGFFVLLVVLLLAHHYLNRRS